uniref:SOCS box domain-containing protein n=2 Tax=Plectus sambesii TaxID=2011161 RepID=A0A914VXU6_9BILA
MVMTAFSPGQRFGGHEYLLKFLLVGDSDVGKDEIANLLDDEASPSRAQYSGHTAVALPKTTFILLEGKRVKLQLWDTSGQGRFATIIRSYSRGAQGILLVYDITNRWSFDGIRRWLKEIDEHAPGVPRILIGNRLHLEFNRAVSREEAEAFAAKRHMEYFEVSTLASFNIHESLTELSRLVLTRNGMERLYRSNRVSSLQEMCCRVIVQHLPTVHAIDRLPLPAGLQFQVKSFANSTQLTATSTLPRGGYSKSHHRRTGSDVSGCMRSSSRTTPRTASLLRPFSRLLRHSTQNSLSAPIATSRAITRSAHSQERSNRDCTIM